MEWKYIKETNNKYSISNTGIVLRNGVESFDSKGRKRITKEKILKPCIAGSGYLSVTLRINNQDCRRYIHRLVCTEFLTNENNLEEVNHKDLDKTNNNLSNLEWISKRGNSHHWLNQEYPGVTKTKNGKYSSRIMINGKREFLGNFETQLEAKKAYEQRLSLV